MRNPQECSREVRRKLIPTLRDAYKLWPAAHVVNFALIPSHLRVLYINTVAVPHCLSLEEHPSQVNGSAVRLPGQLCWCDMHEGQLHRTVRQRCPLCRRCRRGRHRVTYSSKSLLLHSHDMFLEPFDWILPNRLVFKFFPLSCEVMTIATLGILDARYLTE